MLLVFLSLCTWFQFDIALVKVMWFPSFPFQFWSNLVLYLSLNLLMVVSKFLWCCPKQKAASSLQGKDNVVDWFWTTASNWVSVAAHTFLHPLMLSTSSGVLVQPGSFPFLSKVVNISPGVLGWEKLQSRKVCSSSWSVKNEVTRLDSTKCM